MKVLWITEFFPATSLGEITGGVEARCFFVSKYLRAKNIQVKVIARPTSGRVWHHATAGSLPDRVKFTAEALISGLKEDFDIVEGTNSATHLIALLLSILKQKPVVYWYPDVFAGKWFQIAGPAGILGEISDWIVLHFPGGEFMAISEATKQRLIAAGVAPNRIRVVYCGYDANEIKPRSLPKQFKYDICAVSRLLPYKRLEDLIKAAKILKTEFPKLKVAIVGQGPERKKLEALANKLNLLDNIIFLGHLEKYQSVLRIIKNSRIFCHPSVTEGFGIVVVEAMALGVPVVAAKIPTNMEISAGGQGIFLFEPQDHLDLAAKLKTLLTDNKLYRQKAMEARTQAAKFQWEKISAQTLNFYQKFK